jgi:acyl-CoA thioester hydrolase
MSKQFRFDYRVRLDDLDYMGIVGNSDWLTFLERARADLLAAVGYPMERFFAEGLGGVVADLRVRYLRPARFGAIVSVRVSARELGDTSGVLDYVAEGPDGKAYIQAETKMVFVGKDGRPVRMPDEIRAALTGGETPT